MLNCLCSLGRWRWLRCVCLAAAFVFCLSSTAFALEPEEDLPHVDRWVNGLAVSADGVYLGDTWAVDDTEIAELASKRYVLLDQGCVEVLRTQSYPDGVKGDDTEPCEKKKLTASLTLPDGMTGGVMVTIENDAAMYHLSFNEAGGYQATIEVYPGVYEITNVEVSSDVRGDYAISRYSQLDIASDITVPFAVIPGSQEETVPGSTEVSDGEATGDADGKVKDDGLGNGDSNKDDGDSNGNEDAGDAAGGSNRDVKDDELLGNTVRMVGTMGVLLGVYGVIRLRRERALKAQR